jgi:hypothetical protein
MASVAFTAASAGPTGDWIVFECEWPGDFSVARDALVFGRSRLHAICVSGVDRVAVAADQSAFGNGVVRVLSELRDLGLVTLVAQCRLVSLEQWVRILYCGKNLLLYKVPFALGDIRSLCFGVDLVACDARDVGSRVCLALPVTFLHQIGMATQTRVGYFFGRDF